MTETRGNTLLITTNRLAIGLLILGLSVSSISNTAFAQESQSVDSIVALVDDDIILRSELDIATKGIIDRIRQQGGQLPPQEVIDKQVLERLILRRLQLQRAFQTGIRVGDSEIDQAMMKLAQQNNISLMQMRQVIESEGEDFSEFRQNIGEEMMTERLRQRIVNSMDPVTETEVDILLASDRFSSGEYNISHILIPLPEGATPQQIAAQEEKTTGIYEQLQDGLDFASAAISYSSSQEALEGGLVGWRDLNSVPVVFSEAIKDLRDGQITPPIRSPAGFHIVRVNEYRDQSQIMTTEFHARHIMVEVNELLTPKAAMERVRAIHTELIEGASFEELAKKYSDDVGSANLGGDMGWFVPMAYGERMDQTLEALKDGEISEPFQTENGWHIIERLGVREKDITEDALRSSARNNIRQQKTDAEIEQFLQQMRDEAFVEIRLPS